MELNDNQFLKIRVLHTNWLVFEIYEMPERGYRSKRYHLQIPMMNFVNRHKRESKIYLLEDSINIVKRGFRDSFEQPEINSHYAQSMR